SSASAGRGLRAAIRRKVHGDPRLPPAGGALRLRAGPSVLRGIAAAGALSGRAGPAEPTGWHRDGGGGHAALCVPGASDMIPSVRDLHSFLPTTREEMNARGWEELDVLIVTGDAYVDHPAFGPVL